MNKLFKGSLIVASILVAGVALGALLNLYVTVGGTASVEQAVVINDSNVATYEVGTIGEPATAGNTYYTSNLVLKNRSDTTAPIEFVTTPVEGITTSYWSSVVLENKNTTTWQPIADDIQGILTYKLVGSEFEFEFEAEGLANETNYSLIYYADRQDRFVNFGGDNPGALIAEVTANSSGEVSVSGSTNLQMNLPHIDDWNGSSEANYCGNAEGDNYRLCRGAKIWLVPADDYNGTDKVVSWANMGSYLYETDLVVYDDTANDGTALHLGTGELDFVIKSELVINLGTGIYSTLTTEVIPVQ